MTISSETRPSCECPYRWYEGWPQGIFVGCGGNERPFVIARKWYIYVWDKSNCTHKYYCFNDDLFLSEAEFQTRKENN